MLTVNLANTTAPKLLDTRTPSGFDGSWTFGNCEPVNFTNIAKVMK